MRLPALSKRGCTVAACLVGSVLWACSSDETNPFSNPSRGGAAGANTGGGGSSGASTGGATSGSTSGGSSSGGDGTGGTSTGGTTGDGGEAGTDTGGTATGGTSGVTGGAGASGAAAGDGGKGGTPAGGAGMGGAGTGGAGTGGAGTGGGTAGSGGMPGHCTDDGDCDADEYCKKANCDAASGSCTARGPDCRGTTAAFDPVCGCDGITYWNTCVIEHEGFNVALKGECTGNDRPTCSRVEGGDSCPSRDHAHCYRPVEVCGDASPTMGVCWVLPTECPPNEAQTQRYCGGTAGSARCIGLCEVINEENSFRRDSAQCAN